jgi:hypothetical protein
VTEPRLVPPHCDQRVLHAPGECRFCDERPYWQELRVMWGVAFTGHEPKRGEYPWLHEMPCPSSVRDLQTVNRWPGNLPKS